MSINTVPGAQRFPERVVMMFKQLDFLTVAATPSNIFRFQLLRRTTLISLLSMRQTWECCPQGAHGRMRVSTGRRVPPKISGGLEDRL